MVSTAVSTRVLLAYGLPGLPLAVLGLPLFIYLPTFYAETIGIDLATVGLILLLVRLCDVMTDPLVGVLSDRTRGRFGRRRPWILASLPVLCLSIYFLFVPPESAGVTHLLIWSLLLYLGWTMIQLPYAAWGAELSSDYHDRSRVTGVREVFVIIGTLIAASVPLLVGGEGQGDPALGQVLSVLAIGLVVALPAASLIACLNVADPAMGPREPLHLQAKVMTKWTVGIQTLASNRTFRRLITAYLLNGIANGLPATLFLLYVRHVLAMPHRAGSLLFVYFLCAIAGVPFWIWTSGRLNKQRAWIIAMAATCLVFAWAPFLGPADYYPFLAICILSGFCLGADLALPPSMQADVVDLDAVVTGAQRTGLYFALWGMATKLALALAVGVSFPLLALAGFSADSAIVNEASGVLVLALLYGGLPIAFKLAAMALMAGFPIHR